MRMSVISLQVTDNHEGTGVKEREMSALASCEDWSVKKPSLEADMALRLCWRLKR